MLRKLFLSCVIYSFSSLVSAAVITINYTGKVYFEANPGSSTGFNFGYGVGDTISGSFIIDLDNLPVDGNGSATVFDFDSQTEFVSSSEKAVFASNSSSAAYTNKDRLLTSSNSSLSRFNIEDRDEYSDSNRFESTYALIDIMSYVDLGWGIGSDLNSSFSLNESDLAGLVKNYGMIYVDRYDLDNVAGTRERNFVEFNLTSLTYNASEVGTVSAPGVFSLTSLMVFLLSVRRAAQSLA
ncbi:hypothetical protein KUL42_28490 [Alteromonas sp. KUL42]|uniref:hypothetical protein n=1 Tax=Alteromonas sp. KUL42 TaxID=2480797 RepID=UPI00103627B9|nr:hypothetical protein [Alteromonas sp. KUL42]TAP34027.1 hypothetical protein EYR97_13340 [Alteromonas sp. KUL42]GEA08088.1 hypothetical protein KUL42_28490 [Alteromonas sp. KUL42]